MIALRRLPRLEPEVAANLRRDVAAAICSSLYNMIPTSFAGVVARNLGAPPTYLGVMWALTYYGPLVSTLSGRWLPRRRLIAYAVVVGCLTRLLVIPAAIVEDPLAFILVMAVAWGAIDITSPIVSDVTRRIYPLAQRGQLVGVVRTIAMLSVLVAAPLFGQVLDQYGQRVLFPLAAAIGLLGWAIYSGIRPPAGQAETQARYTPRQLLQVVREDPNLARWILAQLIWGSGVALVWPLLPVMLVDRFQVTYTQVGLLTTAAGLASVASYLVWGRLIDRRSPLATYSIALAGTAAIPLGYLLSPSATWLVPVALWQGFVGAGNEVGQFTVLSRLAPEGMYLRYYVSWMTVHAVRGVVVGVGGAYLYQAPWFGPTASLLLSASCFVLGAGLMRAMPLPQAVASPTRPA